MMESREYVIMFVDMQGATAFKYREPEYVVNSVIKRLMESVYRVAFDAPVLKFTGDGAMIGYYADIRDSNNRYAGTLEKALSILYQADLNNLRFDAPPIHLRIGIASGLCHPVTTMGNDLIGIAVDLAARLCAEAPSDGILVDELTITRASFPEKRCQVCTRRLSLKGIPVPDKPERFFELKVERLVRRPATTPFSNGLVALFPDRNALRGDLNLTRLLALATPGSNLLIAGRTLIAWARMMPEIKAVAQNKSLIFRFLLNFPSAFAHLDPRQIADAETDLPKALLVFNALRSQDPDHFHVEQTVHLILDGITCARICLPGAEENDETDPLRNKLIVQQDINDAAGDAKATVLWVCTCNSTAETGEATCTTHGLYQRTVNLFHTARGPRSPRRRRGGQAGSERQT